MKITHYFKLTMNQTLSLSEWLTYIFICLYSDGKISYITRDALMALTGIKKADSITRHTNKLVDKGLVTKSYVMINGKKRVIYNIINSDTDFMCVSNELASILKTTELAFAVRLASLRINGTNNILLSNNEIIKLLNISKTTFYRYIDILIKKNVIMKIANGYTVNSNLFFVFKIKSQRAKNLEADLIKMIDNDTKASKIFKKAYFNNYDGIYNIEGFLEWCISGCPNTLKKKEEEKTYQKITFDF